MLTGNKLQSPTFDVFESFAIIAPLKYKSLPATDKTLFDPFVWSLKLMFPEFICKATVEILCVDRNVIEPTDACRFVVAMDDTPIVDTDAVVACRLDVVSVEIDAPTDVMKFVVILETVIVDP